MKDSSFYHGAIEGFFPCNTPLVGVGRTQEVVPSRRAEVTAYKASLELAQFIFLKPGMSLKLGVQDW